MKKNYHFFLPISRNKNTFNLSLLIAFIICLVTGIDKSFAQTNAGVSDSYITLGGTQYYLGTSGTLPPGFSTNVFSKAELNGTDLGSFDAGSALNLTDGLAHTWRANNGNLGNICGGAKVTYAIYPTGSSGSFSNFQLNSNSNLPNINTYYRQGWSGTANINILSGLPAGDYTLDVYIVVTGSQAGNDCNTNILVDGLPGTAGSHYKANFTIKPDKCPAGNGIGAELIVNGDFSAGNTGFTSEYVYTSPTGNSQPLQYWVAPASQIATWNTNFVSAGDHTTGTGNFMVVDGNETVAGKKVWSQTISTAANTVYIFSVWVSSMNTTSQSQIQLQCNGINVGAVSTNAPAGTGTWVQIKGAWCSGSTTSATFSIVDLSTVKIGNDFGVDDISVKSSSTYTDFTLGNDTSICSGNNVQLMAPASACTYSWFPNAGLSCDTCQMPVASPTVTTTYSLESKISGGCQTDTAEIVITVGGSLQASAGNDESICGGPGVVLQGSGGGDYLWSPSTGLSSNTIANPTATPTVTTTYTLAVSDGSGCTGTDAVVVSVGQSYTAGSLTALKDTICANTLAVLTLSGNSATATWQSSTSANAGYTNISGVTSNSYIVPGLTQTTFFRVVVGTGPCADSTVHKITVIPSPVAAWGFNANGKQVTFNSSNSVGADDFTWDFGDGQASTDPNPSHTFDSVKVYHVCLTAKNNSNCNFTLCQNLQLFPTGINDVNGNDSWVVYPDPFTEQLFISTGNETIKAQSVELFDVLGRRVVKAIPGVMENPVKLDLAKLTTGTYVLRIKTAQNDFNRIVIKK